MICHEIVVIILLVPSQGPAKDEPIVVGQGRELFLDDTLIENQRGVRLKLHAPLPRDVVLEFDADWEGPRTTYVSLFQDGDVYRMYYRGQSEVAARSRVTCYAESKDGIHWTRPSLGLHEFHGSRENNIILRGEVSVSGANRTVSSRP